jgi:hypothetical protein
MISSLDAVLPFETLCLTRILVSLPATARRGSEACR